MNNNKEVAVRIQDQEWYKVLVDDCKSIITECEFTARWALVEGYHAIGKRILEENDNFERAKIYDKKIVACMRESLGKSESTIWRAIQFAKKYPDLGKLPGGKNISWFKICNELLPSSNGEFENKIMLPLPKGQYALIVVDPPWPYGTEYDQKTRRVASPYLELNIDEIKNLSIPSAADCVLWLWTTHKFIFEAKEILLSWGFDYKLILIWDKVNLGIGSWLRCQSEFCLLGIKGNPVWNLSNERDMLQEKRREHSRKPDSFYEMIEKLTPTKYKLDIFSRQERKDWVCYGNEIH